VASKTAWNAGPPQLSQTLVQVFVPTVNSKFTPVPAETRFASLNLHSVRISRPTDLCACQSCCAAGQRVPSSGQSKVGRRNPARAKTGYI
jgi:hypothetical protein